MPLRPTAEQLETLKRLGAATVHEAQGQKGALDSALKPLDPRSRVAGPAVTVDCRPGDNLMVHYALTQLRPGDVLVIDAKGYVEGGLWGDVMTLAAQQAGAAGLIVDGAVRDSESIVEMGFPAFVRGVSIKGTAKNQPGQFNVPIICGGAVIRPGDIVLGDRDGVVMIAADELAEAIRLSEERERKEDALRAKIKSGATIFDILALQPVLERAGFR